MKDKSECKMCKKKFKVDDSFRKLFCMSCKYYKEDGHEMNDDECVTKYGTYYACYKQYREILERARHNYLREHYMVPPRDFVIPTSEIKLTTFVDPDLYRYISALTVSIYQLEKDEYNLKRSNPRNPQTFEECIDSLTSLKAKLLKMWACEERYE